MLALLTGLLIFQLKRWARGAPALVLVLIAGGLGLHHAPPIQAPIAPRFEVFTSQPMYGIHHESPLQGANPGAALFGFEPIAGACIPLVDAGGDGVANFPDSEGTPAGDDVVWVTIYIGEGMAPG